MNGFTFGFKLGCVSLPLARDPPPNHPPVQLHIEAARELVAKEVRLGQVLGPFHEPPCKGLICSPLNLVPKGVNRFRLIHNLAYPYNADSVNANIPDSQATVAYAPFDVAGQICAHLGRGCFMAKADFDSAFRLLPVSAADLPILGFTLDDAFYINSTMAFRARSSCRIFETFAMAIEWAFRTGTGWTAVTHYLDDFFLAHHTYEGCASLMDSFQQLTDFVGAPLSPDKTVGPVQILTF